MVARVAEQPRIKTEVFEPIFDGMEPTKYGTDLVRVVTWAIGQERFARIQRQSKVSRVTLGTDHDESKITESEHSTYRVNLAQPYRLGRGRIVFGSLWTNEPALGAVPISEVRRVVSGDNLHYFKPEEVEGLEIPQSIFKVHDLWQAQLMKNDQPIDGVTWGVDPNIYSTEGLTELAAMAPRFKTDSAGE